MKVSKIFVLFSMIGFGVLFGGCVGAPSVKPVDTIVESPNVTIKGLVNVTRDSIVINKEGVITEITSRKIDLKVYDGKQVSVTGQFSGTTLFVDEVI